MINRVYIEITNVCNLNCEFCHHTNRRIKVMSVDTFHRILLEVKEYTDFIYLHVQGEPLTHPQFDEILSVCDEEKVHVQLVTNGTFLNKHMDMIHHPCLRKVSISLQSVEYQNINVMNYMDTVLKFALAASSLGHPYVELRFWRPKDEAGKNTNYCLNLIKRRYEMVESGRKDNYRIMPNVYVDFDNAFDWPDLTNQNVGTKGRCHGACDQIAILSNGSVVPCCLDADGAICFGNILITPLEEILNSGRYLKMVDGFKHNYVREPFCQKCTFRLRFNR